VGHHWNSTILFLDFCNNALSDFSSVVKSLFHGAAIRKPPPPGTLLPAIVVLTVAVLTSRVDRQARAVQIPVFVLADLN
jgi:hypothetical protein